MLVFILLTVFGLYLTAYLLYQTAHFAVVALVADPEEIEPRVARRFAVLIPAHNEELHLPRLLASLRDQDYAAGAWRVFVIADNCTDGTAAAAARFDVDVHERANAVHRGKGHAIGWALSQLPIDRFDAVVVVDADSLVAPDFLTHLNVQMERGDRVFQCYNGVANPNASWFTRLSNVSRTISNTILHPAKSKMGLSSNLMGNGMCFDIRVLREHPWSAFSIAEDWEYYARLVLAGVHIGYARDSRVYHQESEDLKQASSQRMRWSGGKFQMVKRYGPALFVEGVRTRCLEQVDAALTLVLPNPSLAMNLTLVGFMAAGVAAWFGQPRGLLVWFGAMVAVQLGMFLVGVTQTKDKAASLMSLFVAPAFLVWKMGIDVLSLCGIGVREWKPTSRRPS